MLYFKLIHTYWKHEQGQVPTGPNRTKTQCYIAIILPVDKGRDWTPETTAELIKLCGNTEGSERLWSRRRQKAIKTTEQTIKAGLCNKTDSLAHQNTPKTSPIAFGGGATNLHSGWRWGGGLGLVTSTRLKKQQHVCYEQVWIVHKNIITMHLKKR